MADKIKVKEYVGARIGYDHLIPLLGAWNSFDEIDFEALPDQFVLKCNHDSGSVLIVKDKKALDKGAAKKSSIKHYRRIIFMMFENSRTRI